MGKKPFPGFGAAYAKIAGHVDPGGHRHLQVVRIDEGYTLAFCPKRFFGPADPGSISPFANVPAFLNFIEQRAGKNIRDLAKLGTFPLLTVELRESTQPGQGNFSQYIAGIDEAFSLAEQFKDEGRQLVYLKEEKMLVLANITEPLPADTPRITVNLLVGGGERHLTPKNIPALQNAQALLDFLTAVQPAPPPQAPADQAARNAEALERKRVLPTLSDQKIARISVDPLPPDTSKTQGKITDPMEIVYSGSAAAFSDLGLGRANNEDGFVILKISDDLCLYLVVDGMGGQASGEIASHITALYISSYLKSRLSQADLSSVNINEEIEKAAAFAQRKIKTMWPDAKGISQPGSTVVGALVNHRTGEAFGFHVGDSRLYRLRNQTIALATKDHSAAVEELIEKGYVEGVAADEFAAPFCGVAAIEAFEAAIKKAEEDVPLIKNKLSRALGDVNAVPDIFNTILNNGEILLLCSDGLTRALTNQEILDIVNQGLAEKKSLVKIAQDLKEKALSKTKEANGETKFLATDNITVILVYRNPLLARLESSDSSALAKVIDNLFFGNEDIDPVVLALIQKRLDEVGKINPSLAPQITHAQNYLKEFNEAA